MNLTELTTYQTLVYQSRANRITKAQIETILKKHNLTVMQWSVLGFIKDAGEKGVRISDLAVIIDTSLAFITNSVNALEEKGIVKRSDHSTDSRSKIVTVSPESVDQLNDIEKELRDNLIKWLEQHIGKKDLGTVLEVMQKIASLNN